MDRRSFLSYLAAGAAALGSGVEIDYERALWVPGAKTIFLPAESVFVPTPEMVDRVLAAHGIGVPRYHLTVSGRGTVFFDKQWRPISGADVAMNPLVGAELAAFQRKLWGHA